MNTPVLGCTSNFLAKISISSGYFDARAFSIFSICVEIADNILLSNLLNSSKQHHEPTRQIPIRILLTLWKSKVSSQQNTSTIIPRFCPRALIDSVFPVPAGPTRDPPRFWFKASDIARKHVSIKEV
ncbi:hypothetical protein OGAPHI_001994 [Ogataea philodendri]|uniref:Uncharacterized protein n=1 Tax=Ogataea philodendri TaxID=1378263 RepID=A0A9P8T7J5_9ASCO|nr:uncharacterized protein OGAPHI_001994 [Ogataea philodendri]KAH3668240.1 hypothetical protein OGAPHI_001994 [Ogataea philodendri]